MSTPVEDSEARSRESALAETPLLTTVGVIAGVVGVTALVFALVLYVIDPDVLGLTLLNLGIGIVCLVFYATTNWRSLSFARRSSSFVIAEAAIGAGIVAAVAAINWFASQSNVEWDLTRDRLYSLSEQSVKVASGLSKPVQVIGFFKSTDAQRARLLELVELYRKHTDRLELEILNPDAAPPAVMEKYQMSATSPRIVITSGDGGLTTKIRQPTEELLTNALVKVAEKPKRKIYFLGGHGEPRIEDEKSDSGYRKAAEALRDDGYEVATLSIADADTVPVDSSVIVCAGALKPLLPNEAAALEKWLERGGRVLLALEPGRDIGLASLFEETGIVVGDDVVVDPNPATRALNFGPDTMVIKKLEAHPITDPLEGNAVLFQSARSVSPKLGQTQVRVVTLVQTSPQSWAETKYLAEGEPERDEADLVGPVPIAVAATRDTFTVSGKVTDQARLVVFGDSAFASNRLIALSGNGDLFSNAVNWLAGDEQKMSIRPRFRGASSLAITSDQHYRIMFFSVNLLPLVIVGFGFSVWAVRRRK